MKFRELPIIELDIDPSDDNETGVTAVALVDNPAIEKLWLTFNEELHFAADEDRRIITGPLMIPNFLIFRRDDDGREFFVKFSPRTIENIALKFMKEARNNDVNVMHDSSSIPEGVFMFESFITDRERGILPPEGFSALPEGTWFGSYKVESDEFWNEFIKPGKFKGFSVEGMFISSLEKTLDERVIEKINILIKENSIE